MRAKTALIPMLAAAALAAAAPGASAGASTCAHANTPFSARHAKAAVRATLCLLNRERRRHHLRPLHLSHSLGLIAHRHSRDMVRRHYFAHGAWYRRIVRSGYIATASRWQVGENVGWGSGRLGTPAGMVNMWMRSPEHRANILTAAYRDVGIGIAPGNPHGRSGATYTTDFGGRR